MTTPANTPEQVAQQEGLSLVPGVTRTPPKDSKPKRRNRTHEDLDTIKAQLAAMAEKQDLTNAAFAAAQSEFHRRHGAIPPVGDNDGQALPPSEEYKLERTKAVIAGLRSIAWATVFGIVLSAVYGPKPQK